MGQNQARAGEQQGTVEEKEPSPDPGGSEKEGNASEVTCREVEDESGLVKERLDVSPGIEPASPTLKLDTHLHKTGAPPIDWEWIQGGDGEREGGRERGEGEGGRTEVRGLQKLNNIRVTKRGTLSTEVAGSLKPECKATAERSNRMDLENSANDSHGWKVIHKDNIQDLAWDTSSREENVHFQQSKSSVTGEKTVASQVTGSLKKQDGSSMTDIVAVPGINTLHVTEDFHDDHFPFEMPIPKTEAPTRAMEKDNLESPNALLRMNLPTENPLWQDGPAPILMSFEPSLTEGGKEKNILSELGSSGVQEYAASPQQIYGKEIPSLPITSDLLDRLELKKTESISPLNIGDVWDFATTVERKIRDKLGKLKKHHAASSDIESGYTTETNMTNPDSSVMASLGMAIDKGPPTSGFEDLLDEQKHSSIPDLDTVKNNEERKIHISYDAGGVFKESEELPLKQEDRVDYYPPAETASVQTENIPEQFLAVVTGHSEVLSLPDVTKSIMGELDPHLALYAAMESEEGLSREREMRNHYMFLAKAAASESDWDKLSGNIMFSNPDRDKGNPMATEKHLEEQSPAMLEKAQDKSFGEMTSWKTNRDNQSVHKNLSSVTDIHQEASVSISNTKLIPGSERTAGHEEGRPLPSHAESKTCVSLTEISKSLEKNMTHETKLHIEEPIKAFTDPVKDRCGGSVLHYSGTDTSTSSLDVQNSQQVHCMQLHTDQNNLIQPSTGRSLSSDLDTTMVSQTVQSTGIRDDQTPVSAQAGVPGREKTENAPKGKPVSDLIKETIQLHEKMKEWTKPAEAKADVVLDSAQSVKVAQMKAAFDSPKKSADKGLEKKPSVRKGKTQIFGAHAS